MLCIFLHNFKLCSIGMCEYLVLKSRFYYRWITFMSHCYILDSCLIDAHKGSLWLWARPKTDNDTLVKSSLIGWAHTENDPCTWSFEVVPSCLMLLDQSLCCIQNRIWCNIPCDKIESSVFNPRPLRPKGYCRHLRLSVCPSVRLSVCPSVCLSVPIILVNTITQPVYPISPPNLLGSFNMALSWMVL